MDGCRDGGVFYAPGRKLSKEGIYISKWGELGLLGCELELNCCME